MDLFDVFLCAAAIGIVVLAFMISAAAMTHWPRMPTLAIQHTAFPVLVASILAGWTAPIRYGFTAGLTLLFLYATYAALTLARLKWTIRTGGR